jgi:ectoine hydroxylase-related dioxygenase (phytanoyl-CoA dioxygenase family)
MFSTNDASLAARAIQPPVEQFERDLYCLRCSGFAVLPNLLDSAATDALLETGRGFEDELEQFVSNGGRAHMRHAWPLRTTRALYAIDTLFQDLILHPVIQRMAQAYLGPNCRVRDCLMQTNMPDPRNVARGLQADMSFHRDTRWTQESIVPLYLHAFVLLHECTRANGCTVVVPGTHRAREPGYYFKDSDPRTPQPGIDYRVYEQRYFPSAVHLEAPRGSLIFLDPMVIHTQGINVTPEPRSLLNVTFRKHGIVATPPLLNACALASRHARVPVRQELLAMLESAEHLPSSFGPLGARTLRS